MRVLQAVVLIALLVAGAFAQSSTTGFQSVVQELASFQAKNGGFSPAVGEQPTLEATANALYLSSLYGLLNKIDVAGVGKYLESLKEENGVVRERDGMPATSASLRDGLLVRGYVGGSASAVMDKSAVEKFVKRLWDEESKLFASRAGGEPSLKATAEVLEALMLAGLSDRDWAQKMQKSVRSLLEQSIREEGGEVKYFAAAATSGDADSPAAARAAFEANVYAVVAARYAGLSSLPTPHAFARYFLDRVHPVRGGIGMTLAGYATLESTYQGILALTSLGVLTQYDAGYFASSLSGESMMQVLYPIPHGDLLRGFMAHYGFSHLPATFKDAFHVDVSLDTVPPSATPISAQNPTVVQGTSVTPFVLALPFSQPHAGLHVEAIISHASVPDQTFKLLWNAERYGYTTEESFDTNGKLGELIVRVRVVVPTVGGSESAAIASATEEVGFTLEQRFNIGYTMQVESTAKVAGREVAPHAQVTVGAEFSFTVSLSSTSAPLTSGNFDLVFSVLDSSNVVLATSSKNFGKSEGASSVHFHFELKDAALPAGRLTFRFHVLDHATNTIHTTQLVSYELAVQMVATNIQIQGGSNGGDLLKPSFQLGKTATVTMQPASLPDLVTLYPYRAVDALGADASQRRAFFMDTYDGNNMLRSFAGILSKDALNNLVVTFTVTFPSTFDAIGIHNIRFRYAPSGHNYADKTAPLTASGDVYLANYDSSASELYDEHVELGFTVQAELYVTEVENAPKPGVSLKYGDPVRFSFKVKDRLSNDYVAAQDGFSSLFLALTHEVKSQQEQTLRRERRFVSARHALFADPRGTFEVAWFVNPNAIRGAGALELHAVALGGKEVALVNEKSQPFSIPVSIGGEITYNAKVKQASIPTASHGAAVVEFEMMCQEKRLNGAILSASLVKDGQRVGHPIPVARSENDALYSVSWSIPEADAHSAHYTVDIHRHATVKSGDNNDEDIVYDHDTLDAPLFSIPVQFEGSTTHFLPFRTEALVLTLCLISFGFFSYRKFRVESQRK